MTLATVRSRAGPATLEWRVRAAPPHEPGVCVLPTRQGVTLMKDKLSARLFSLLVTAAAFALFIVPLAGKRW